MEQNSADAVAKAAAFANGLRKNVTVAGRRWAAWPGGARALAAVVACIDAILQRLLESRNAPDGAATAAACIAELRVILEWTTYQSASLATARAVVFARKTRTLAERLGLLEESATSMTTLMDSEEALIDNVRTKNGYMLEIAERHAHLGLPRPIVDVADLSPKVERRAGKLDFIQQLIKSTKVRPRKK
jgi:hypothetical protein